MSEIKDLFAILVILSVNVINHVILVSLDYENCKCRKKLVDKLVEGYTENVEEVKLAKITSAEDENKHKCSSCTLYIVLFSMIFTSKVGIGTYFVYYKCMNGNKELLLNMILFINYQLNKLIN